LGTKPPAKMTVASFGQSEYQFNPRVFKHAH
jgi:hypothetical protein